jgi:hypothetical protein
MIRLRRRAGPDQPHRVLSQRPTCDQSSPLSRSAHETNLMSYIHQHLDIRSYMNSKAQAISVVPRSPRFPHTCIPVTLGPFPCFKQKSPFVSAGPRHMVTQGFSICRNSRRLGFWYSYDNVLHHAGRHAAYGYAQRAT